VLQVSEGVVKIPHARVRNVIAAWLGILILALGIALTIMPETYQSLARVKTPDGPISGGKFPQAEFEVICSEPVLGKVVTALHLQQEWKGSFANSANLSSADAIALLKTRLHLRVVPNTEVIEILVFSHEAAEAAKLANAVAEAYIGYCHEQDANLRAEQQKNHVQPVDHSSVIGDSMVEIIDSASPAVRAIFPNQAFCASLVLTGALLLGFSLCFRTQRQ
jgi:uncharacterized protein involved in exopolysaccharide biosynthesis